MFHGVSGAFQKFSRGYRGVPECFRYVPLKFEEFQGLSGVFREDSIWFHDPGSFMGVPEGFRGSQWHARGVPGSRGFPKLSGHFMGFQGCS